MKIQIRNGIFETNSSTIHTITICHEGTDYSAYVGKTIVLGKDVPDDVLWNESRKHNVMYKLHQLWISSIGCDSSVSNFIHNVDFIKKTLLKIGINVEIETDEATYKKWELEGEDLHDILNNAFKNEETLIDFIFNYDSWYDGYEDNYQSCPYEDEIAHGNETYYYRG